MTERVCQVDGCGGRLECRGLCNRHYLRWRAHGSVDVNKSTAPIEFRFQVKVEPIDGCWIWVGAHNQAGYGQIWHEGRLQLAHRVSYELFHGPIPAGLQIDHLCNVKCCVHPDHLEPVTRGENKRRDNERRRRRAAA